MLRDVYLILVGAYLKRERARSHFVFAELVLSCFEVA